MAILCWDDPRLEYIAFMEDDSDQSDYHLALDPLFSFLFAPASH